MATPPTNVELAVEVIGSDVFGQQFFEHGQTLTVYSNGLSIRLKTKLARDSEVIVRKAETNTETVASVLGQLRDDANGQIYALAFVNPPNGLLSVPTASDTRRTMKLECGVCHSVLSFVLSGIDLEVYEAMREVMRTCEKCKSSRAWREAKSVDSAPQPRSLPKVTPGSTSAEATKEERRKTRRTPMKGSACIRYCGMEITVTYEDVSKGGFRFVSRKEFPEGTRVEAAVPYTKFSNNIFTHAIVVYCRSLPDGQFRHGVAYSKSSGSVGWDPQDELH